MKRIFQSLMLLLACGFMACNGDESTSTTGTDSSATKMSSDSSTTSAPNMDATVVSPEHHKVLKDSAGIRIVDVNYGPGDSSAMHSHPDNVLYVLEGSMAEFTMPDGSKVSRDMKAGSITVQAGSTHAVKNTGKSNMHAIQVEVSRPNNPGNFDASMDVLKIAPAIYKLVKDTLNLRVLMATIPPGGVANMHGHPDHAIYSISGGSAEFTDKDGGKHVMEMPNGSAAIMPAGQHAVKNTGKVPMKVFMVEVNRAQ